MTTVATPAKVEVSFTVTEEKVIQAIGGEKREAPTDRFLNSLAKRGNSDSGILPPGLLSIRTGGDFTQLAVQIPPDIHTVCWGDSEGGGHKIYQLAMPWCVIVGVFRQDQILGARIFYSPRQVTHLRDPLYHANVPNLNCMGYNNNVAVGWLCLYLNGNNFSTLSDKARLLVDRAMGGEPFNNGNMYHTDGTRVYYSVFKDKKKTFLWDPEKWQEKSDDQGVEWTLDPDLWIPVLVKGLDDQTKHDPKGIPLTLGMALYGKGKFYYRDDYPKPYDGAARDRDATPEENKAQWESLGLSLVEAAAAKPLPVLPDEQLLIGTEPEHITKWRGVTWNMTWEPGTINEDGDDEDYDGLWCEWCESDGFDDGDGKDVGGTFCCNSCVEKYFTSCAECKELFDKSDNEQRCYGCRIKQKAVKKAVAKKKTTTKSAMVEKSASKAGSTK